MPDERAAVLAEIQAQGEIVATAHRSLSTQIVGVRVDVRAHSKRLDALETGLDALSKEHDETREMAEQSKEALDHLKGENLAMYSRLTTKLGGLEKLNVAQSEQLAVIQAATSKPTWVVKTNVGIAIAAIAFMAVAYATHATDFLILAIPGAVVVLMYALSGAVKPPPKSGK